MNPDQDPSKKALDDYLAKRTQMQSDQARETLFAQQSAASRGSEKKRLLIGIGIVASCFALTVLFVVGLRRDWLPGGVTVNQPDSSDAPQPEQQPAASPVSYPPDAHPRDIKNLSEADDQRYWDMTTMSLRRLSFKQLHGRPYETAHDINTHHVNRQSPLKDPVTGHPYVFTDGLPKRGEMMYKLGYKCKDNLRGIGKNTGLDNVYIYMVLMDDGSYLCKSNIQ